MTMEFHIPRRDSARRRWDRNASAAWAALVAVAAVAVAVAAFAASCATPEAAAWTPTAISDGK